MSKLVRFLQTNNSPAGRKLYFILRCLKPAIHVPFYYLFRFLPLEDKVVASAFNSTKYGDNPAYITEKLHALRPETEIVWMRKPGADFSVPNYVRTVNASNPIHRAREYATAKVWIESHRIPFTARKRKNQLFIETWHGGLGVKKLDIEVEKYRNDTFLMKEDAQTCALADVFLSNSGHLDTVYRNALHYQGPIWHCGYPCNDLLLQPKESLRQKVREYFCLPEDTKILTYAPTFRDNFRTAGVDMSVYDVDFPRLHATLTEKFGGDWIILMRLHPFLSSMASGLIPESKCIRNATDYPEMQELICASDLFLSDYSSSIFDAAIAGVPGFTFCKDYQTYKADRGVYYEMPELPFPYSENNDELCANVMAFDDQEFANNWRNFSLRTALCETGHASDDVAQLICDYLQGNHSVVAHIK